MEGGIKRTKRKRLSVRTYSVAVLWSVNCFVERRLMGGVSLRCGLE